ncbi:hypothetical protein HNY73_007492 [Argiope bruennichi]|uniref:Uncharacterized protein n=1 Tax=Argiope bruennichi TaxID=94029 RepID=A0A8T0FGP1_ARGBR|nr:hypothetical protein HNY73_007492 [Argiope bruennichi]
MDEKSNICLKSELDLFSTLPTQLAIDSSSFVQIHPVASLSDTAPIEFYINGNGEHYLDLAHSILHLQIKILKKNNNSALGDNDNVAPINYILNTMFSEFSVFLNDKQVASQSNYSYRSFFESLLFSSKSSQDSLLSAALFRKDTAAEHDNVIAASTNEGFKARKTIFKNSKIVDLIGILHYDLAAQPKLLINGVNVRIKLERQKDSFSLLSNTDNYKIGLISASLFIRKINVAPSIVLAQEKALERGLVKIPIRRAEVRSFALSSGIQSSTIANAFIGQLPTRLILGFVSNEAYNGNFSKNPFNFRHYNLNYLSILEGSKMIPSKPFKPNFANNLYARSYLSLFTDLNRFHNSQNINISYEEYPKGYTLYAIDLTPDMAAGETHMSINRTGNIAIDIKFDAPLTETKFFCGLRFCGPDPTMNNDRKRMIEFTDNDVDDFLISTKKPKRSTEKPKYNLDLSASDGVGEKQIAPFSIHLGKGVIMEIKEFRGNYYVGLSKTNDSGTEVKNRFNIPLIQLETLRKGCEAMIKYVKECDGK